MSIRQTTLTEIRNRLRQGLPRHINEVIIHHTWAPTAAQYKGLETWQAIRDYHMRVRGWSDIGYHYGVAPDGTFWALRPVEKPGAHTLHRNEHSIGVVFVGNYDLEKPDTILPHAARLVETIISALGLDLAAIRFHREFQNKTCPGMLITLGEFREQVKRIGTPALAPKIFYNGKSIVCDLHYEKGVAYCQVRPLAEALGYNVSYDARTGDITLSKRSNDD